MDEIIKNLKSAQEKLEQIARHLKTSKYHKQATVVRQMRRDLEDIQISVEQDFMNSAGLA